MMAAPSAVLAPLTSTALPLFTFRILKAPSPAGLSVHFWQLLLFEGQIWTTAPLLVEAPVTSSNLPLARPSAWYCPLPKWVSFHFWLSPPLQPHWTASVPSAVPPETRSITLLLLRLARA